MLIKTIIPINSVQGLKISNQPISLFHNHLNVRVVPACCSPLSGTTTLLSVLNKLWIVNNSYTAALLHQNKCRPVIQALFTFMNSCQNYRQCQVNDTSIHKTMKMKELQGPPLSHKAIQWGCPAFC